MNTYLVKYPDGVVDVEEGAGPFFLAFRVNRDFAKVTGFTVEIEDSSSAWAVYGGWPTKKEAQMDRDELLNYQAHGFNMFKPQNVRIIKGTRWDDFDYDTDPFVDPVLDIVAV